MKQIILSLIVITSILYAKEAFAYIDPGTAGAVVGGVSAGLATIFAFFGSLAIAAMIKVKKLWHWNWFGRILIALAILILIALIIFSISFFI